jgi:geranylgeranyl reductase family protein
MMRMNSDYDVIVVGGGPGGSTAARSCSKAGLKTLLVEKERLPRYKPCGGCLSAKTVRLLGFDLSPVIENTIYGAKFTYCSKDPFLIESKNPIAFLVMRDRFDQFLIDRAFEVGTEIMDGEAVTRVEERADGVDVELIKGKKFRCQYLIGADGSGSLVAKSLSLSPRKNNGYGVAVESETPFDSSVPFPKEELQLVHLDFGRVPNGYAWVFPKKNCLSIGIGGMFRETKKMNPRQYFKSFLKGLSYLPEGKAGKVIGHLLPSFYDENQKVSQGRFLLVGDAAHLMDPLQGEGIYYAVRSGMLAAEAILEWKREGTPPSDFYQKAVSFDIFENLKWALSLSHLVFRFTKLAYRTLKRYPELGEIYIQVLEGKETYQGFVIQVKERMKDFLKGRLSEKIRKAMAGT